MMLKAAVGRYAPRRFGAMSRDGNQLWAFWSMVSREFQRDLKAAGIGHLYIEEDRIRAEIRDERLHFGAPRREPNIHTFASQQDAERHHGIALIVDNENAQGADIAVHVGCDG